MENRSKTIIVLVIAVAVGAGVGSAITATATVSHYRSEHAAVVRARHRARRRRFALLRPRSVPDSSVRCTSWTWAGQWTTGWSSRLVRNVPELESGRTRITLLIKSAAS